MNHREVPLEPGLFLVSTPIGNARDITLRALDTLASANIIAAEDTRTARKLMEIHGISIGDRKMVAYHDHSTETVRDRIVSSIAGGQSVAYVSEAGTPLLADPGFQLARAVRAADLAVTAVPGASALLTALAIGGLPTDRIHFAGFLPNTRTARQTSLAEIREVQATLVLYESPKRIVDLIDDICTVLGETRQVAICRELTKKFEEVLQGTAAELRERLEERTLKGEIVVLIGAGSEDSADDDAVRTALVKALATMRVKDAATAVAGALGRQRRDVYQIALEMKKD